jgi:asparagine N-glycosylation enzyme membrane subunit Stt3
MDSLFSTIHQRVHFSKEKALLILLFIIAFSIRFFFQFYNIVFEGDEMHYAQLAKNLYYGKGYTVTFIVFVSLLHPIDSPDLYWPPLLPYVIYIFYLVFGVSDFSAKLVSVIFGSLLVFPVYFLGKKLFNKEVGFLSAILIALSRNMVWFSIHVISDILMAFFLTICLYWNIKNIETSSLKYSILSGLFFGLCYLTRFSAIIFFPILIFNLLLFAKSRKSVLFSILVFIACFSIIISPWLIRNMMLTGQLFYTEKSIPLANYMLGGNYEANFYGLIVPPSPIQIFMANPFSVISKWFTGIYLEYKVFPEYLSPLVFVLGSLGGIVSLDRWRQRLPLFGLIFTNIAFYGIAVYAGRIGAVNRYNLAIYPFIFIFCARGVLKLRDLIPNSVLNIKIKNVQIKQHIITIVVLIIVIEALATVTSNIIRFEGENDSLELHAAGIWLKNNTPPEAILMCRQDTTAYYAERPAVMLPYGNFSTIMDVAKKYEVQYIVVNERIFAEARPEQEYLLNENNVPPNLKTVYLDTTSDYKVVIYSVVSYDY